MSQLPCHLHIRGLIKKASEVLINSLSIQLAVLIALSAKLSSRCEITPSLLLSSKAAIL